MSGRNVISSDSHVIEPPQMWREYIDPKMRDRAPHLTHGPDNDFYCIEGLKPMDVTVLSTAGTPSEELKAWRRWDAPGRLKGGWDPAIRKQDAMADGVDAEVLYATLSMKILPLKDMAYKHACFTAYNRWLADFCNTDPQRFLGMAVLMTDDIASAVKDLHAVRKMGLRGAMLGMTSGEDVTYASAEFDPLWAAAQELDMPLAMHNFTQGESKVTRSRFETFASAPADVQYCISSLIFADVFERFPRLKILSVENDIGWAANYLQRLDHSFHRYSVLLKKTFKSGRLPSEQFRDHVFLTFMDDMAGIRTYDLIGVDNVMWANDYPHGDSTFPHSREAIARQFDGMREADRTKILRDNVLKLFNW
jgi:predicted TIM-barrel fold metal-dependent hydrolase